MADRFLQTTPAVTPARTPRQHTAFVRIKSGLAALRDFKPAYVGSGSIATDEVEVTRSGMSASPLKADNLHTISASPLSATLLTGVFAVEQYGGTAGLLEGNPGQFLNQI